MRKTLLYLAIKYNGNYKKIYQAIKEKEIVPTKEVEKIESKIKCNYITLVDANYPNFLKVMVTPPFVLFYYGDISLMNNPNKVAVIGNRAYSLYGKEMTQKIVKELKDYNATIVSGLALGIDGIAHKEALDNNMKTIAILGGGIDYCYPMSNLKLYEQIKKEGLVISEYPNDISPEPQNFLIRNRLIASISDYVLVTEAKYKSGTMNTVAYALEFGKDIFAVPYLANSNSGCNYLIKQGAKLVECAKDIYE
ncbi:MAG: DNA-processing protein DprA [Bacilli bacterium]|nr:DNA-processing protein DprA [Bacilli bacterium]